MIIVKQVKTAKERKQFVEFPLKLYKNNKYFVPPLYMDEMALFKKDYYYYDNSDAVYFIAYDNEKPVGRISGIIQRQSLEKYKDFKARFTRFDSINSEEVASALFLAVENWAKSYGMKSICGPLGFSDLEREGLLVEGFNELSTFEEQYNYEYYGSLIEKCGYVKEIDWIESKLFKPKARNEKLMHISEMAMARYKLHPVQCKTTKELVKKYLDGIFDCLDECYAPLYGTVPFTEKMKNEILKQFLLIVDPRFVGVIVDENKKVIAFGLSFPSIGKAVQKSGGRLTPACLFKILKAVKHPKVLDLGLVAVLPKYQAKGVNACIIDNLMMQMMQYDIENCETNLNLEDNIKVLSQWKFFDHINHKRRRSYIKNFTDTKE